jgi:hypothetical protein
MADEPRKPDGKQRATESKAGSVTRLESLTRSALRPAPKPDLDLRNQQMVGPRRPAGPPLEEPDRGAGTRSAARASQVEPTDPAVTRTAERREPRRKARRKKAKRSARRTTRRTRKSSTRSRRRR